MTNTITLPEVLSERRKMLTQLLKETVVELTTQKLKENLGEYANQYEIEFIEWEFYPESDDEGGSVYYPNNVHIEMKDKDSDPEELMVEVKSRYSDDVYEYSLYDIISEYLCDNSSDLYDYDIESIRFEVK